MDDDKQPQSSDDDENPLLKQRESFHQFIRECSACQEEVEPQWQNCVHCGPTVVFGQELAVGIVRP